MDFDEEPPSGEGNSVGAKALDHFLWLVSRSAFVLVVLCLAWLVKIPVDRIINRDLESNLSRIHRDEKLEEVREMNELVGEAEAAQRAYIDLFRAVPAGAVVGSIAEGDHRRRIQLTASGVEKLEERFRGRKMVRNEDFEVLMERLLKEMRYGLNLAETNHSAFNVPSTSAGALNVHIELSNNLMRMLRMRRDVMRSELRK